MPIIFKNPGRRRRNPIQLNPRRRKNALRLNPMLEMDFEEDLSLPMLSNPKRRRNMSKDEDMRRLREKFRSRYGKDWAEDEKVYLDYLVEKKQARGSKQSAAEIKRIAREKRVSERGRFK